MHVGVWPYNKKGLNFGDHHPQTPHHFPTYYNEVLFKPIVSYHMTKHLHKNWHISQDHHINRLDIDIHQDTLLSLWDWMCLLWMNHIHLYHIHNHPLRCRLNACFMILLYNACARSSFFIRGSKSWHCRTYIIINNYTQAFVDAPNYPCVYNSSGPHTSLGFNRNPKTKKLRNFDLHDRVQPQI